MSGLEVRSGSGLSVETEALLAEAARLSAAAHIVDGWAGRAAGVRRQLDEAGLAASSWRAILALDTAHSGFAAANRSANDLSHALVMGAGRYAAAEGLASWLSDAGKRIAAGVLGMAAPTLLLAGASAAATALGPALLTGLIHAVTDPRAHALAVDRVVREHGLPVLSDPAFVGLVRAAVDQTDEFVAGLFRSQALFAAGSALEAPENANLLIAAAAVVGLATGSGALRETEVTVTRSSPAVRDRSGAPDGIAPGASALDAADGPVRGVADLADRVPASEEGAPQIRIERYDAADGPRWIVYSGGTVDFGTTPAEEPYDMTSNVHGVADASLLGDLVRLPEERAASERAVREAMAAAHVAPGDPVIVVGHSAGGMVAANLAADPDLEVVAAVNLGGPAAQVSTGDTPVLSVAHSEDLVPATGGSGLVAGGRIEVERSLGERAPEPGASFPAHALAEYQDTARLIDRSDDPRLGGFRQVLMDFTDGAAPATVSYWRAERIVR
jgi:hypothetical protein